MKLSQILTTIFFVGTLGSCSVEPIELNPSNPEDPDGLSVVLNCAKIYNDSIVLKWVNNANTVELYNIYRKEGDAGFEKIGSVDNSTFSFADLQFETAKIYHYYVESVAGSKTEKSNEIKADANAPSNNQIPEIEYYLSSSTNVNGSLSINNQSDVYYWSPSGSDLDIEIYNYSSVMDIAYRIWDADGNFMGEFNSYGAGYSESSYDLGYSNFFIVEIYSVNNIYGNYQLTIY